uniref:GSTdelta/epsilon3 n=1 Tax=Eurytemora affinis TaxID=88015 RepID=A0A8B0MBW5_EURAF|nr:GSTdelta/epsilon3 [Eurytemora affinis]
MAPIELHGMAPSAPCRTVAMAAECAGVDYTYVSVNPMQGETKTPEFLAMNPTHTIPTIKDGDYVLYESRPIASYIMNKYCKDEKMNPQDPETRGLIDQRLYFDMGILNKALSECIYPVMMGGQKPADISKEKYDKLKETLGWLDGYVAGGKFAAGTTCITVADLALVATYSTLKNTVATQKDLLDVSAFKNVEAWFEKCKGVIPNYEKADGEGAKALGGWYNK